MLRSNGCNHEMNCVSLVVLAWASRQLPSIVWNGELNLEKWPWYKFELWFQPLQTLEHIRAIALNQLRLKTALSASKSFLLNFFAKLIISKTATNTTVQLNFNIPWRQQFKNDSFFVIFFQFSNLISTSRIDDMTLDFAMGRRFNTRQSFPIRVYFG